MSNLIAFSDHVGRTIIAEQVSVNDSEFVVKNPAILIVQQQPNTGQLAVQLLPFFFREFVNSSTRTTSGTWVFNKENIVYNTDIELDPTIAAHHAKLFADAPAFQSQPSTEAPTIKLFDDEK